VFENLNGWEFVALLLLALLIFGERLPKAISDGLRMLRNLRRMATNATGDLSRELGTDIKLEDLNPKTFVRKHILSEEDQATLTKPLQSFYDDVRSDVSNIKSTADDIAAPEPVASAPEPSRYDEPRPAIQRNYDDMT
jgi:sec-independent protein translocase protein TatB